MSDSRRSFELDIGFIDTYTLMTRDYALQISVTHRLVSSVYYNLH
jgi:hypothetical protein